ncbi:Response regulator receiver domain-containing protein [Hymenobacter gelipurpurascens]|uniref:Response regulator receiver domain-containing protein n=1 Tax=Hymenobacter gelipurpurascens TaxID=89968 RepID=A0A212T004_9BACT|nr:response regulator [Hymenobacter gelipurpurascens]SNC59383.1 Response regulator receiver domain-containing protein [Hymenobacter gelipurpurascens]
MRTFLIDDDNLGNYLTESLLRVEGFSSSIQTFESAENALEVLQQRPAELPEIIFLDLNMPVMNGWQFLDALAPYADVLRDHCHIYVLTSSLALSDLEKAKTYDLVTRLIHKPIDVEELRTIRAQLKDNG